MKGKIKTIPKECYEDAGMAKTLVCKGNDVRKACIQLLATYKYFKQNFDYTYIHCRFVSSKVSVPATHPYEFKQMLHFIKKNGASFKYASKYLEDVL